MTQILVLYHSVTGNIENMAQQAARGVGAISGCEAILRTVPPLSPTTSAVDPAVPASGAPFATLDDLAAADGLLLGSPTRFGNMSAELKYFIDGSSSAWFKGSLAGKPASVFTSSGSMHGGQESTLLTMMVPLLHHGMLILGLPYSEARLATTERGGTPYGASHVSGSNGDHPLDDVEKQLCQAQGRRIASVAQRLKVTAGESDT